MVAYFVWVGAWVPRTPVVGHLGTVVPGVRLPRSRPARRWRASPAASLPPGTPTGFPAVPGQRPRPGPTKATPAAVTHRPYSNPTDETPDIPHLPTRRDPELERNPGTQPVTRPTLVAASVAQAGTAPTRRSRTN